MPQTVTGATLLTMARERVEFDAGVNADFLVSDAELYRYLDGEWDRVYNRLVKAHPERYTTSETITGDGATTYTPLPDDYLGTVGVDWQSTSGVWVELQKLYGNERNAFDTSLFATPAGYQFTYTSSATQLEILPHLASGEVCRHLYVVTRPRINDSADTVPDEYNIPQLLAIGAALRMLIKEESSTQYQMLKQEQKELGVELEAAVQSRQVQQGHRVTRRRNALGRDPDIYRWKFPR